MSRLAHKPPRVNTPAALSFKRAVIVELARRGWSQTDLARATGRARTITCLAINTDRYPKHARRIAEFLNIKTPQSNV